MMQHFWQNVKRGVKNTCLRGMSCVLPPTCLACGELLAPTEPMGICPTCWQKLPRWNTTLHPVPQLPSHISSFSAPFVYEGEVRQWIPALKFYDQTHIAPILADFMAESLVEILPSLERENVLLLPIPLHPSRLRKRLFNQSALLAKAVSQRLHLPWHATALKRIRKTETQVGKTRRQRLQLSATVFWANPEIVRGKTLILVDDLFTTGATMQACAKALKQAGAKEIHALTVAYVAP